jgi:PAS domain S-box-containing protein
MHKHNEHPHHQGHALLRLLNDMYSAPGQYVSLLCTNTGKHFWDTNLAELFTARHGEAEITDTAALLKQIKPEYSGKVQRLLSPASTVHNKPVSIELKNGLQFAVRSFRYKERDTLFLIFVWGKTKWASNYDAGQLAHYPMSSELYEELLEVSLAGFWDWNMATNYEYLSPRFKAMFGYEDHEMENHPSSWQKLIYPEDAEQVFAEFDKHVKSKGEYPFSVQARYHHRNGETIHILCSGRVTVWGEDGSPLRAVGTHVDITEQVRIKKALEEAQIEYRNLIKYSSDIVVVTNEQGHIDWVSDNVEEQLGYTPDMVRQHTFFLNYLHPDDQKRVLAEVTSFVRRNAEEGGYTARLMTRSGAARWYEVFLHFFYNDEGQLEQVYNYCKDIHKAKIASDALVAQKEEYANLIEYSADIVVIYDSQFRISWVSNNIEHRFGYKPEEVIGQYYSAFVPPQQEQEIVILFQQWIKDRVETAGYTGYFRLKSGEMRWFDVYLRFFYDDLGQPKKVINYCKDIHEQRTAQHEREALNQLKVEFVSMASHQFRTPMAVFAANLEMLQGMEQAEDPLVKRILNRMATESDRMIKLVDDVLLVSKMDTKGETSDPELVDLIPFVEKLIQQLKPGFGERHIQLDTALEYVTVKADPTQLEHILKNLIENAIKYSPGAADPVIAIWDTPSGEVQATVTDFGMGIPEQNLEGLFQQFYRGDNVKNIVGTGLGLYVVKRFAELNDIRVEVRSKLKQGTVFTLTFKPV